MGRLNNGTVEGQGEREIESRAEREIYSLFSLLLPPPLSAMRGMESWGLELARQVLYL